jgi:hypothetical protein
MRDYRYYINKDRKYLIYYNGIYISQRRLYLRNITEVGRWRIKSLTQYGKDYYSRGIGTL